MLCVLRKLEHDKLPADLNVGAGLFLGHIYCITINSEIIISDRGLS